METCIILERHGESIANTKHIYAGHSDFALSERGFEQAALAAEALASLKIDAIYSSSLKRAVETAEPHARLRGLEVRKSDDLREIFLGAWEGKHNVWLRENYPYEADFIWNNYFGLFRAPDGESAPAAAERFYTEVSRIAKENEGKTVLVVAHAAVIRLFWGKILGLAPEMVGKIVPFPTNTSFSYLEWNDGRFSAGKYSSDEHIKLIPGAPIE